jgi:hypothetical protein
MPNLLIQITRDSVCAGDDCDAPHGRQMEVSELMPLKFVIQDILESGYLAKISGGRATWLIEIGEPVGVVTQQWKDTHFFVNAGGPIGTFLKGKSEIHFKHEAQNAPEEVVEAYKRHQRESEHAKLATTALVKNAIADNLSFKDVIKELKKRPPSRAAAELVLEAYRKGDSPPWLTAVILGECRDKIGYTTVREILLAAPSQLAENYAGVALAQIAGPDAFQDLIEILFNAKHRHSREGAAHGLATIGSPEAAKAILDATLSGKLAWSTSGSLLGKLSPEESLLLNLLNTHDKNDTRLATEILWSCLLEARNIQPADQIPPLVLNPSRALRTAMNHVLEDPEISMMSRKRADLRAWLDEHP